MTLKFNCQKKKEKQEIDNELVNFFILLDTYGTL